MRKMIVTQFLTLDGVMRSPGVDNGVEGGFKYGGWQMPYLDDGDPAGEEEFRKMSALLLSRKTADVFAAFWPTNGKDFEPFGPVMNSLPKYVASSSRSDVEWQIPNCCRVVSSKR